MVVDHGKVDSTKPVLVHGAAGNVGAYAVQLARRTAREVVATASSHDVARVHALGADWVIDFQRSQFEEGLTDVDVVLDTIGGDTQDRSFAVLKPGGVLVSVVAAPDQEKAARLGVRALFFLVEVSSDRLEQIAALRAAPDPPARVWPSPVPRGTTASGGLRLVRRRCSKKMRLRRLRNSVLPNW